MNTLDNTITNDSAPNSLPKYLLQDNRFGTISFCRLTAPRPQRVGLPLASCMQARKGAAVEDTRDTLRD